MAPADSSLYHVWAGAEIPLTFECHWPGEVLVMGDFASGEYRVAYVVSDTDRSR